MQDVVRLYAEYRIKQHAPLRLLTDRLVACISVLRSYYAGGRLTALA